jgi:hypothetical protein
MISMHFHQLFPPARESDILYSLRFRRHWMRRLRRAFSLSSSSRLSYWTTESRHLNAAYRKLSGRRVGVLPIPSTAGILPPRTLPSAGQRLRIGYVGDGRQEKGLLHFLCACQMVAAQDDRHTFVLQVNNPRGFTADQECQLKEQLALFTTLPGSEVINGGLPPKEHHALIQSIDILVLPYSPVNYWRRISGLLIQAALQHCVVIVSSDTWAAEAVGNRKAAGAVFEHGWRDDAMTLNNLSQSILRVADDYPRYAAEAVLSGEYYRRECRPSAYIERLFKHYDLASGDDSNSYTK